MNATRPEPRHSCRSRSLIGDAGRLLLLLFALAGPFASAWAVTVAAASDLKFALTEIAARYERESGEKVVLSFGSSGNFARQIPQGAPFDLFMSADEEYVFRLADQNLLRDRGQLYAIGRLALLVPHGSTVTLDSELRGLRQAIADGRVQRLAVANPLHAPYGRAAKAALERAGLWLAVADKLVLGENVAQAAQFALSGSAQGGIVAWSLVKAPELARHGSAVLIPESWHPPLRQRMALTRHAGDDASRFYDYLQQPAARAIFERYGFALPSR